ncbi:MAG: hypothetical protein ACO1PB_03940 [Ramlibacter sp.]
MTTQFGFENEEEAAAALGRCGLGDVHSIPYDLAQQVGLQEPQVAQGLAQCAARGAEADRTGIVSIVESVLNGAVYIAGQPTGAAAQAAATHRDRAVQQAA